jgi:hypothetical protein
MIMTDGIPSFDGVEEPQEDIASRGEAEVSEEVDVSPLIHHYISSFTDVFEEEPVIADNGTHFYKTGMGIENLQSTLVPDEKLIVVGKKIEEFRETLKYPSLKALLDPNKTVYLTNKGEVIYSDRDGFDINSPNNAKSPHSFKDDGKSSDKISEENANYIKALKETLGYVYLYGEALKSRRELQNRANF